MYEFFFNPVFGGYYFGFHLYFVWRFLCITVVFVHWLIALSDIYYLMVLLWSIKRYKVVGVIILNIRSIIESYLTKKYHHVLLTSFWAICLFPEWFCMESWIASKKTSLVRRLCFFFRWCITVLLQLLFSGQKGQPYHRLRSWETFIWSWTDSVDMFEYWQYGHWDSPSAVMVKFSSLSIAKEGWGQFIGTLMDWSRAVLSLICSAFSSWCSLVSILSPFSCTRLMVYQFK